MLFFLSFSLRWKSWKDEFATFLVSTLKNFPILELPEPSTDLKAWSFQLRKNYICMLNIERPIAHQSSITFFLRTLYIDNTFRTCGKDSPDKKPRARLISITIRVNQI